jgi:hypothetical protein
LQVDKGDLTVLQKAVLKEAEEIEGDKHPTVSLVPCHLHRTRKTLSNVVRDNTRTELARHLAKFCSRTLMRIAMMEMELQCFMIKL